MKTIFAMVCALAFIGTIVAKPVAPPAKVPAPATKPAEPKKEEEPKIEGMTLARANGTFLGLKIDNGTFKLSFYDAKKKPAAVDVTRATARWPVNYKLADERAVLNPSPDGKSLIGSKSVRPPFSFKLYLTLLNGDGENAAAVETFVIDFHG